MAERGEREKEEGRTDLEVGGRDEANAIVRAHVQEPHAPKQAGSPDVSLCKEPTPLIEPTSARRALLQLQVLRQNLKLVPLLNQSQSRDSLVLLGLREGREVSPMPRERERREKRTYLEKMIPGTLNHEGKEEEEEERWERGESDEEPPLPIQGEEGEADPSDRGAEETFSTSADVRRKRDRERESVLR